MKTKISSNKAFTLIELLVVVLIIGILAAIAVPQYQVAVAKSKYSTIKNMAKSIADTSETYYLTNGKYSNRLQDLDITIPNNINCWFNITTEVKTVSCETTINKQKMQYQQRFLNETLRPGARLCIASKTKTHLTNKICKQETGKTELNCGSDYCSYIY